jgi:polyphosphate kinase
MGSADWMTRNLDRRIETITPILDRHVFRELKEVLRIQWSDNTRARIIDADQSNAYVRPSEGEPLCRAQYDLYAYLQQKHG